MNPFFKIKSLVLSGRVRFTQKAIDEMEFDGLTEGDVVESIANAPFIRKSLKSRSPNRRRRRETLYVLIGLTFRGVMVYTKGSIRREAGTEVFYVLISAKRAITLR